MLSFSGYVVFLLVVESDSTEVIASLVDVDYDLLEIKMLSCIVLDIAPSMVDIHFAKCLHFCNLLTH